MTALVWYCRNRKCRRLIRAKGDQPVGWERCRCEVPMIGSPTRVSW